MSDRLGDVPSGFSWSEVYKWFNAAAVSARAKCASLGEYVAALDELAMTAENRYVSSHAHKRKLWDSIAEITDMETGFSRYEVNGDPVLGARAKTERDQYRAGLEKLKRRVSTRTSHHQERYIQEASSATLAEPPLGITLGDLMKMDDQAISQLLTPKLMNQMDAAYAALGRGPHSKILRIAGQMNTPDSIRSLLPELLAELGVELPSGVLRAAPSQAGRPLEKQTLLIQNEWDRLGRPDVTGILCDKIGKAIYPEESQRAAPGSPEHRRIRERVRQAIMRSTRPAT